MSIQKDIAIIGMAGRFPDAQNLDELLINLKTSKDSVHEISEQRIHATTLPPHKVYKVCGYLEDIDRFDYPLFGISRGEALDMSPALRILLEIVYETIGNAAYNIDELSHASTSVFVNDVPSTYYHHADEFSPTLVTGNSNEYLAARIARQFKFTGSVAGVNASCASSLFALYQACNELMLGFSDYALVCGVNIDLFPFHEGAGALGLDSPDGKSKAFSAEANGMSFGELAAAVLLKPLHRALEDNDNIHAVIKGLAVNNNAHRSASPTAPHSDTQAEVIRNAWQRAGITPADIGYIEAHGSGTQLGDSLEIAGLNMAFREYPKLDTKCPISTIKSNIGHGRSASAMAGLVKAVLALKHKLLFPSVHFKNPSPVIDFENAAVTVSKQLQPWETMQGKERVACVTAVGASGVNCHAVLTEAPPCPAPESPAHPAMDSLITVSSRTLPGLRQNLQHLKEKIDAGGLRLRDIAYTLNKGRTHYDRRFACIVNSTGELSREIETFLHAHASNVSYKTTPPHLEKLVFIFSDCLCRSGFTGKPAGFDNLCTEPQFLENYRACLDSSRTSVQSTPGVEDFAFQYAFYKLLENRGITTENILGIGIGKLLTSVITGELTMEQGINRAADYQPQPIENLEQRVDSLLEREAREKTTGFITMGPGSILGEILEKKQTTPGTGSLVIFTFPNENAPLMELALTLYTGGYALDWHRFYPKTDARKIELPVYQFEKIRCWLREEPRPEESEILETTESHAPASPLKEAGDIVEETIAQFWRKILEIPCFSLDDDFFEIGGDSLKASKVINQINKQFMLELSFEDIFDFATIRTLAEYVREQWGTKQKIAVFWKEVLKVETLAPDDDFFQLGGHSLLATQIFNRIKKEFQLTLNFEDLFYHPTLSRFTGFVEQQLEKEEHRPVGETIEPAPKRDAYPLSSAQKRIYLLQQIDPSDITYNTPLIEKLEGDYYQDRHRLEEVFRQLIARHESLRTAFRILREGEGPVQVIQPPDAVDFRMAYFDVAALQAGESGQEEPTAAIIRSFVRPFDLTEPPLLRAGLIKIEDRNYLLIVDMHHIITDGTSERIFVREFESLYKGDVLPPLKLQYKDYCHWQQQQKEKQDSTLKKQEAWWLEQFQGELPMLDLPTDAPRPAMRSVEGRTINFHLDVDTTRALKELAHSQQVTLFILLLSLYSVLMAKLGDTDDVVVGTPIAGRLNTVFEQVIGIFINTLALRNYPEPGKHFDRFLAEVRQITLAAFENQSYQFEDLVEKVADKRDLSRSPLFDVMFVFQNYELFPGESSNHQPPPIQDQEKDVGYDNRTAKFDLIFTGFELGDQLKFRVEYSTSLFRAPTIHRFILYFKQLIANVLQRPTTLLYELDIMPESEKDQLLHQFNQMNVGYPQQETILHLFSQQVERCPMHLAVLDVEPGTHYRNTGSAREEFTYRELDEKSTYLAWTLNDRGLTGGSIVALYFEPGLDMIIAILAVLKAGAAYLPIDPQYPDERMAYMIKDANVRLLITNKQQVTGVPAGVEPVCVEEAEAREPRGVLPAVSPQDPAYIIYTSGTTGKPKGVILEQGNLVRLFFTDTPFFEFGPQDVWTLFHSYCFDFSVWEMYGPLLTGGRLVIVPRETVLDPALFWRLISDFGVTILNQTPSAFYRLIPEALANHEEQIKLRNVIFGGEALAPGKLKAWRERFPRVKLINMYGITETTVHVTYKEIGETEIEADSSNIGGPIPTLGLFATDSYMQLVPVGVAGECCVGGAGVARGYLNRPELTDEKFVMAPFMKGQRMYRSGDRIRLTTDGEAQYLGRIDNQIKIRGYRIELGEIENRLISYNGVRDALVTLGTDDGNDTYLCAYVVPDAETPNLSPSVLKEFLAAALPAYMVPAYFVQLDRIPLTANQKIDRQALPHPLQTHMQVETYVSPRTPLQEKLSLLWQQVLHLDRISIEEDFFNLGGDSIKTIRLIGLINKELNTDLKIIDCYTHGTIEAQARKIEASQAYGAVDADIDLALLYRQTETEIDVLKEQVLQQEHFTGSADQVEDIFPMSDIEKGMAFYYLKKQSVHAYHDQFVMMRRYLDFDPKRMEKTIQLLMKKHPILRTAFYLEEFDTPIQVVYKQVPANLVHRDLSGLNQNEQEEQIVRFLEEDLRQAFDINTPPLWRIHFFELDKDTIAVVLVCHHAILDGWSIASLTLEIHNTYLTLKDNPGYVPEKLACSYKEMVVDEIVENQRSENLEFWRNQLKDYKRLDFLRTAETGARALQEQGMIVVRHRCEPLIRERIRECAKQHATSVKNLCFGAYAFMLNMLSGEYDITAGCVTNNRIAAHDSDKVLGCFLNTVPVRLTIPESRKKDLTWREYIRAVEEKMLEVKKHERISLFRIARVTGEVNKDQNPIFDTLFNFIDFHVYENAVREDPEHSGAPDTSITADGNLATNTLFDFEVDATAGNFVLIPKFDSTAISREMVERSCVYFERLLLTFIQEPNVLVDKNHILPPDELERILYQYNNTAAEFSHEKTIHSLFEEQAVRTPQLPAVTMGEPGEETMTYEELNREAHKLACILREKGLRTGDLVGIMMPRCIEMVVGVLAILKAGGAYVPFEPYLPDARIARLLNSLTIGFVLTHHSLLKRVETMIDLLPHPTVAVCPDQCGDRTPEAELPELHRESTARDLAYVIFTSGSTGVPKGVVETHQPVINVIEWVNRTFEVGADDKVLFITSLGFDLSVYDIFGVLAAGGCIRVVPHEDLKDPSRLIDIIMSEEITFWDSAPAALQLLVPFFPEIRQSPRKSCLRLVFLSGDWIPVTMPPALKETFDGVSVISLGGATEASIWSNYYPIKEVDAAWSSIPYGKPIQNAKYYILDQELKVCPPAVPGDLYIGGSCLASGYMNDVELSAGRFIKNPYVDGGKMYKTGDIARWFEDGNMEFLGRRDYQVKIRGFRIELGEIEAQLNAFPHIRDAVVLERTDGSGEKYLCAYYISHDQVTVSKENLKNDLLKELPEYMVPAYFVQLEQFPVTPNGKLDRKAFPAPDLTSQKKRIAPSGKIEIILAQIWADILGIDIDRIGMDSDFFELGGHSLSATRVIAGIHKKTDVKIPLVVIFKTPTLGELAAYILKASQDKYAAIEPAPIKEGYALSAAQARLYFMQSLDPESSGYNLPELMLLEGDVDVARLEQVFNRLIVRHESLRTSFHKHTGSVVQKIHKPEQLSFAIEYYATGEKLTQRVRGFVRAFDLAHPPLFRVSMVKIDWDKHVLMLDMHHIISDGTSMALFAGEIMHLYRGGDLPDLRLQYKDFSEWQNSLEQKQAREKQKAFWLETFSGTIPTLNLPTDYPRPNIQSFEGGITGFEIDARDVAALKTLVLEEKVTLYMALLALFNILLFKLTGHEDIIVGTALEGRRHEDLRRIIGMFVNTLAMRNFPTPAKTFREFLMEVKERTLQAFDNQDFQFEDLVDLVGAGGNLSRNPLFDVAFGLNNQRMEQEEVQDLRLLPYKDEEEYRISRFDMVWAGFEETDGDNERLFFKIEFRRKLFKPETVDRFGRYFQTLITAAVHNPEMIIKDIPIISEQEQEQLNIRLEQERETINIDFDI